MTFRRSESSLPDVNVEIRLLKNTNRISNNQSYKILEVIDEERDVKKVKCSINFFTQRGVGTSPFIVRNQTESFRTFEYCDFNLTS